MADENVNIQDEADYYYDMTPTAEEIDNVLVDLVAALKDVGEFDVVKRVKAINGERAKFVLGEGGSGKTVIPGALDQLVAADGQGNAKANSGYLFSKMSSIGEHFSSASLLESKLPAMKIELAGTNSTEDYWENPHSGILAMTWNPLVQFLGDAVKGSPVFSMTGKGIIDIDGGKQTHSNGTRQKTGSSRYIPWMSEQAYNYYDSTASPFFPSTKHMDADGLIYPYFMMKESATALLEGSSLVHICGGSSLFMDGNADVRITGGYANGGNLYQQGRTFVEIDPGSTVIMSPLYAGSDYKTKLAQYTPVFIVTPGASDTLGQLIVSAQGEWHDASGRGSYANYEHQTIYHTINNSGINHIAGFYSGESFLNTDRKYRFVRSKLNTTTPNLTPLINMLSGVKQPSIMLQGKTNFIIGDTGTFGARIGCSSPDSRIGIDWTTEGNVGIKLGSESGAMGIYEFTPAADSITHFKFGPDESCKTAIAIEPHGIFSYKVAPEEVCGINFTPAFTDIVNQWHAFEGTFNGNQVYAQVEGNSHFEFLDDSTVIMRGPSTIGWDASTYTNSSADEAIRITTSTNCDGFTYKQFFATLTDKQKEEVLEFLTPNFSSKGKVVLSGTVTATEHYGDRYHIVVEGATVPKASGTSYNFTVVKSNTYSRNASTVMGWQEFTDEVKKQFGENAVASSVTVQDIRSYSWGYSHRIQAQITNASASINSETEYAIGTSYEDLTDKEKTDLRYGKSTWDFSEATVISNDVRSDMTYDNVCQNYTYRTGTHLCQDWIDPVYAKTGPVTQMYGLSNFCMRGNLRVRDNNRNDIQTQRINTFTITSTEAYDFSKTRSELINDLINGTDYAELKRQIEGYLSVNTLYHFDHIYSVYKGEENTIQVSVIFEYKKIEHMENLAPLVEIIGNSEIRIANGISITTDNIDGESAIKIAAPEGEVSFTLAELKALKDLIINPPAPTPTVSTIAANTEMEVGTISTEGETGNAEEVEE